MRLKCGSQARRSRGGIPNLPLHVTFHKRATSACYNQRRCYVIEEPRLLRISVSMANALMLAFTAVLIIKSLGFAFYKIPLNAPGILAVHMMLSMAVLRWSGAESTLLTGQLEVLVSSIKPIVCWGVVGISGLLAGSGLLRWDESSWLAAPLGGTAAIIAWRIANNSKSESENTEDEEELDSREEAKAAAEDAKPETTNNWFELLLAGSTYIGVLALFLVFLGIGAAYFGVLKAVFFEGGRLTWAGIGRLGPALFEALFPSIFAITIVLGGLFFGIAIWNTLVSWRRKSVQDDIDRELSDHEIELIKHCIEALESYAQNYSKNAFYYLAHVFTLVILIVPWGAFGWAVIVGDGTGIGSQFFQDRRVPESGWYLYSDLMGAADILMLFTFMILWGTVLTWLGSFSRWGVDWSVLNQKTQNSEDADDRIGKLKADIALDVRKRLILTKSDFEPSSFLRRQYQLYLRYFVWASFAVVALNAVFFYLDRRAFTLVTQDSVTHVDYWSGRVHRWPVSQVEGLEFDCGMSGDTSLRIMASVLISKDRSVKVMDFENPRTVKNHLPNRLSDMETLSATFRAQGTIVTLDLDKDRSTASQQLGYCRTQLERQLDSRTAERVVELMRPNSDP